MSVRELEVTCHLNRDRLGHKRMNLLDFDLGMVEHQHDKIEREVSLLGKHFQESDDESVRAEKKS